MALYNERKAFHDSKTSCFVIEEDLPTIPIIGFFSI
jgi:hypothetical protein